MLQVDFEPIAYQLYASLRAMPCRCQRKWDRKEKEEFLVIITCSRCKAVRDYETMTAEEVT